MSDNRPAYFDFETVALLRGVLDDAWASLRPEQRATMLKTTFAERDRLLDAALMEFASEDA